MSVPNEIPYELLRVELEKKGLELDKTGHWNADGSFNVTAKLLHPIKVGKYSVFYPITIALTVFVDKNNGITTLVEKTPRQEWIREAEIKVERLIRQKAVMGLDEPTENPTHMIEINEKGQPVVKRTSYRF